MSTMETLTRAETRAQYEKLNTLSLTGSPTPLKLGNSLDKYEHTDSTPVIGTEFAKGVQLSEFLKVPNTDELIRDLAILVSQRGVVFFRDQDITPEEQKILGAKLGELTGKPKSSQLHLHPHTQDEAVLGKDVTVISSERNYKDEDKRVRNPNATWHVDITYETIPSDYALLKVHTVPEVNGSVTGGDTVWASAYEAYDRLSPSFAKYVEGLSAVHEASGIKDGARERGLKIRTTERGSPGNYGEHFEAIHPVVRTNPVTGWRNIFVNPLLTRRVIGVTKDENDVILKHLFDAVRLNHDLQVRFKWEKDSLAIWDNRSTLHKAIPDYGDARREGDRVVSIGERPYFDPTSKSRREALGLRN